MWDQIWRILKKNGTCVLFCSQPFTSALIMSQTKRFKYCWTWEKPHTGQLNCKKMPLKNVEDIAVFQETLKYNPQFTLGKAYICHRRNKKSTESYGKQRDHSTFSNGERYPMQILKFPHDKHRFHPTQKPVALLEYLIKTYTQEGETVLDFTAGSMSTAIACINTNRKGIMIEKDEHYFKVGSDRVVEAEKNKECSLL